MTKQKILPDVQWYVYFIIAFITGFFGGLLISHAQQYVHPKEGMLFFGWLLFLVSIIFDILAIKSLITEAHIKALEIFYGKERMIQQGTDKKTE